MGERGRGEALCAPAYASWERDRSPSPALLSPAASYPPPSRQVCLTGHSLGGSVASVLMLMLVHRGALPPERLSPCLVFGAPAVFCEQQQPSTVATSAAAASEAGRGGEAEEKAAGGGSGGGDGGGGDGRRVMQRLGLGAHSLVNVMMSMDMVPRSFACDFSSMVSRNLPPACAPFHDCGSEDDCRSAGHGGTRIYNLASN